MEDKQTLISAYHCWSVLCLVSREMQLKIQILITRLFSVPFSYSSVWPLPRQAWACLPRHVLPSTQTENTNTVYKYKYIVLIQIHNTNTSVNNCASQHSLQYKTENTNTAKKQSNKHKSKHFCSDTFHFLQCNRNLEICIQEIQIQKLSWVILQDVSYSSGDCIVYAKSLINQQNYPISIIAQQTSTTYFGAFMFKKCGK